MVSIEKQIESGRMVCPATYQRLHVREDHVSTADGSRRYPLVNGVPILFVDTNRQAEYFSENEGRMDTEYRSTPISKWHRILRKITNEDYRTRGYKEGFQRVVATQPEDAVCLSVGGGPNREHPNLVNLNIGPYLNVDVVADAYLLPYAENSVDAIYCEAVLEHLEFPDRAVAEMFRVLKHGAPVFAATPFLQWYHGYPNHFQNFTLTGHERLFTRAGFTLVSSGTSVGPTVALLMLSGSYLSTYLPTSVLRRVAGWAFAIIGVCVRPLDKWINRNPRSHYLASATFVHATKP